MGLQQHFQDHTEHDCDIVSVLSPEGTLWDLISSYETFSKLDLSAYDCVISGKYPAWMVNHPNHICYMLHRLRGLYDTYPASQHHPEVLQHPKLRNLAEWLEEGISNPDPDQIPELFDRLHALRQADLPSDVLAFPGAFSRAVIHFSTMRRSRPCASSAMRRFPRRSHAARPFPPDVPVDVLYPPPHRDNYSCGEQRYFFTSSRLDRPKRIDLLIEAIKQTKTIFRSGSPARAPTKRACMRWRAMIRASASSAMCLTTTCPAFMPMRWPCPSCLSMRITA